MKWNNNDIKEKIEQREDITSITKKLSGQIMWNNNIKKLKIYGGERKDRRHGRCMTEEILNLFTPNR